MPERVVAHRSIIANRSVMLFKLALGIVLVVCVALFALRTWHWPLSGDATLMHYVVFLMDHGMAPYRQIIDPDLPGSYLIEWMVVHTLGDSSLAWRAFDFALMGAAALAMIVIALPYDWFAGAFAGALFALLHGADGVGQPGQRDFTMAVLLLIACASLFAAVRRNRVWPMALFGLAGGAAAAIKPTALPFAAVLLLMALFALRQQGRRLGGYIAASVPGFAAPLLTVLVFLLREHAFAAFFTVLRGILPFHASLARHTPGWFVVHLIPPLLLPLLLLAIAVATARRDWLRWEYAALWLGVAFGAASFAIQGKGYPYQRYPLLAFLLIAITLPLTAALRYQLWLRYAGYAGLVFAALVVAPVALAKASRYEWWKQEFVTALEGDLASLDGAALSGHAISGHVLSGHVQCIDTTAGCDATLYLMKLLPSTGMLYDCYLLAPPRNPEMAKLREQFLQAVESNPPAVFVVTNELCFHETGSYAKLDQWPEFSQYLTANYAVYAERKPVSSHVLKLGKRATPPFGYRVYVRKQRLPGYQASSGLRDSGGSQVPSAPLLRYHHEFAIHSHRRSSPWYRPQLLPHLSYDVRSSSTSPTHSMN